MAKVRKHNETMYLLCQLTKHVDDGTPEGGTGFMTSWIREAVAIPGATLDRLEDTETGVIETGWTVLSASGPALRESMVLRQSHNHDQMKRLSDI
jgi:hypothetical protein